MADGQDYGAVNFGGFFINNFNHLCDLEGVTFQITSDDLIEYIDTCYNSIGKCPSSIIVKKIEERGYSACSDGKGMILGALNIHEQVETFSYLAFAMSVQRFLYSLFPNRKDGAGVMWREYTNDQAERIMNMKPITFKIFDGVLIVDREA